MNRGRKIANLVLNPPKKIPPDDQIRKKTCKKSAQCENSESRLLITLDDLGIPEANADGVEEYQIGDLEIINIDSNISTSIIEDSLEELDNNLKRKHAKLFFSVTPQELGITNQNIIENNMFEKNTSDQHNVVNITASNSSEKKLEPNTSKPDNEQPSSSGLQNKLNHQQSSGVDAPLEVSQDDPQPSTSGFQTITANQRITDVSVSRNVSLGSAQHCNLLIDNQTASTSGLHNDINYDFDSDDSVSDVTWHPPIRRDYVAECDVSEDEVVINESDIISNEVNSLRVIVNKTTQTKARSCKNISRRQKKQNKYYRNTGQAYHSYGKERQARQIKELGICRFNCKSKIPEQVRKDLFERYWQLGSYEKRVQYIGSLITVEDKKVCKVNSVKNRSCTFGYYIHYGTEVHERVCKQCFMTIFDETPKFVFLQAIKKRESKTGILPDSIRGASSKPKWSDRDLEKVRQHILSFPQYESHYGRNKTSKKFLPSNLTLEKMYSLYCDDIPENERVCKTIYTKIFRSENLSFKPPKVDTCTKCDKLQAKIQYSTTPADKENLVKELNEHHEQATRAYDQKKNDKILSETDESLIVLTFDLQQCLPTPLLSSGMAFYKRSLWTFNLTIHNCKDKKAICYMWHEGVGKRGGNQIASCLYDYIKKLPLTVKKIILYSDTCGGQNKNSFVAAMFLTVMKECPHIEVIDHKFLVPGHTHMECDYDHSVIEKAKKRVTTLHLPRDYYQMVRSAGKKGQFTVREMTLEKFYNFEKLLKGPIVLRKVNTTKEKVHWPDIAWFRYTQNDELLVHYKKNLINESNFMELSFKRLGRSKNLPMTLTVMSETPLPISVEKKKDLIDLLPFIDSDCHEFYKNLKTSENERAEEDPDLNNFDEDREDDEITI